MNYISVSQVNSYLNCSLQYFFRYIAKAESECTSSNLVFGQAIHDAVLMFVQSRARGIEMTASDVKEAFTDLWSGRVKATPDIEYSKKHDFDSLNTMGQLMVERYREDAPVDEVLAVEERVEFKLPSSSINRRFVGYLDLITRDPKIGSRKIVELKTSASRYAQDKIVTDLQATAYCLALSGDAVRTSPFVPFEFRVLTKSSRPSLTLYPVYRDKDDFERFTRLVESVIRAIEAEIFMPRDGSWMCSGCAFRKQCASWHEKPIRSTQRNSRRPVTSVNR